MRAVPGWRALTWMGSLGACALTARTVANLRTMRQPDTDPAPVAERVSVLLPVPHGDGRAPGCLESLLDQTGVADLEILVLIGETTDGVPDRGAADVADRGGAAGTDDTVRAMATADPRVRLLAEGPAPTDLRDAPHARSRLADAATGSVLVFLDPGVRLAPHALAAAVGLLRGDRLDLLSPFPRQLAETTGERLVQPLLPWSWLTTPSAPETWRSPWPPKTTADGRLLVADAAAYRVWGGHAAAAAAVPDDIALARAAYDSGWRTGTADGSRIASCRMYTGWQEVQAGYATWLWATFGSRPGAALVLAGLGLVYLVPPLAALRGSTVGLVGYTAAVAGRYLVAERTGGRSLPDSLAHPVSIGALAWLTAESWREHHRRGSGGTGSGAPGRRTPEGAG